MNTSEQIRYTKALKKVEKIKGFYKHLTVYICIIPFVIFINLKFTPHFHWFWFSALGWGVGVLSHAFQAFQEYRIFLGKDWEEQKIKELLRNENNGK